MLLVVLALLCVPHIASLRILRPIIPGRRSLFSSATRLADVAAADEVVKADDSGTYIMCGACKTAYKMDVSQLGPRGLRVKCSVCDKEWFQTSQRMLELNNGDFLQPLSEEKIEEVKRIVTERKYTRGPMTDRIGIFVGNLPYDYEEEQIGDLFGEYGVRQISLIRDQDGLSKGFAFVEVCDQADADQMIKEMHHFHTDGERRLTVRLADNNRGSSGGGRSGSRHGDGGEGRNRGSGGRGGDQGGSSGGGKAWSPRG